MNRPDEDLQRYLLFRTNMLLIYRPTNWCPTAHAYVPVDVRPALAFRTRFNAHNPQSKLSLNDIIIKATANALPHHPLVTATYNGKWRLFDFDAQDICFPIDLGLAIELGLIRSAPVKSLAQIALESSQKKFMARKAREIFERKLETFQRNIPFAVPLFKAINGLVRFLVDWIPPLDRAVRRRLRKRFGSFLITNVGPAGIRRMEGPILVPDVFHLMIAASQPVPCLENGKIATKPMMPLIAKYDPRIFDVGPVARFLHDVRENLENPDTRLGPYPAA